MQPDHDYLRAYLEYYWLRPETAVWRALDCAMLGTDIFKSPSLDIGCGDGAFSFLRAQGRFSPEYDAFHQVDRLDNFFSGADIYDSAPSTGFRPLIAAEPRYQFDAGLDHKTSLLEKAKATGLYKTVKQGDAGQSLAVGGHGTFETIFSNIIYWIDNFSNALRGIAHLLSETGRAYLFVPSDTFRSFSFYQQLYLPTRDPRWQWLELLDRGRSDNVKACQSLEQWTADFEAAGLRVVRHKRYLSRLTVQAWDVGLRPLSPLLIEMAARLKTGDRAEMKAKWIETLLPILRPFMALDSAASENGGFFLFELEAMPKAGRN